MGSHSVICHPTEVRIPSLHPAKAGTRFSDPGSMQDWVDLYYVKADWPGIEHATCKSQVQHFTAVPPRNTTVSYCMFVCSPSECLLSSSVGSAPHSFPNFQHPSHELLRENGFVWQVYNKYHTRCLKGNHQLLSCSSSIYFNYYSQFVFHWQGISELYYLLHH